MLFLAQTSVSKITYEVTGSNISNTFYDKTNSTLGSLDTGAYGLPNPSDTVEGDDVSVSITETTFVTDVFSWIKNKVLGLTGISYLLKVINAVPNFLGFIGFPIEIVWALGALWHGLSLFLLLSWLMGRGG